MQKWMERGRKGGERGREGESERGERERERGEGKRERGREGEKGRERDSLYTEINCVALSLSDLLTFSLLYPGVSSIGVVPGLI